MKKIYMFAAAGASSLLLTLALSPAALAGGALKASRVNAAQRASGTTYKGKTTQNQPFKMVVKGKTATLIQVGWVASCAKAGKNALKDGTAFKDVPITSGQFGGTFKYKETLNNGKLIGKVSGSIAGKVNSTKTTGAFKLTDNIFNKKGQKLDTCKTGTQGWSASKA